MRVSDSLSHLPSTLFLPTNLTSFKGFYSSNWRFITFYMLAGLICATMYVIMVPSYYVSLGEIFIDIRRQNGLQEQSQSIVSDIGYIDSQVLLIQSNSVIERVVEKLNLSNDREFNGQSAIRRVISDTFENFFPTLQANIPSLIQESATGRAAVDIWVSTFSSPQKSEAMKETEAKRAAVVHLQKILSVRRIGASYIIDITLPASSPKKSADIVNAIIEAYIQADRASRLEALAETSSWLEGRLENLRQQALSDDRRLQQARRINSTGGLAEDRAFETQELFNKSEASRALYQSFQKRLSDLSQQAYLQSSNIRVITPALPPAGRSGPSLLIATVAIPALMLVLASLIAALVELERKLINRTEQIAGLGLSCLGEIRYCRPRANSVLRRALYPLRAGARIIRWMSQYAAPANNFAARESPTNSYGPVNVGRLDRGRYGSAAFIGTRYEGIEDIAFHILPHIRNTATVVGLKFLRDTQSDETVSYQLAAQLASVGKRVLLPRRSDPRDLCPNNSVNERNITLEFAEWDVFLAQIRASDRSGRSQEDSVAIRDLALEAVLAPVPEARAVRNARDYDAVVITFASKEEAASLFTATRTPVLLILVIPKGRTGAAETLAACRLYKDAGADSVHVVLLETP